MTAWLCISQKAGDRMCLGILGGLGPMASAYFLELIVAMTDVKRDQDHPDIILMNAPSIPDRTAYITGKSSENPVISMIQLGQKLKNMSASIIATPCMTAHYFHKELQDQIGLPVINAIHCCAACIQHSNIKKVGLMATDGTVQSRIFHQHLEAAGIEVILPTESDQRAIMSLIYGSIKAGSKPDIQLFNAVHNHLRQAGAEMILLGCTELSLLKKGHNLGYGKPIKQEYRNLFIPICQKE